MIFWSYFFLSNYTSILFLQILETNSNLFEFFLETGAFEVFFLKGGKINTAASISASLSRLIWLQVGTSHVLKVWMFHIFMQIFELIVKISSINTALFTNPTRVFHVETTWKRPFPSRFNVEYTWCVCRVMAALFSIFWWIILMNGKIWCTCANFKHWRKSFYQITRYRTLANLVNHEIDHRFWKAYWFRFLSFVTSCQIIWLPGTYRSKITLLIIMLFKFFSKLHLNFQKLHLFNL